MMHVFSVHGMAQLLQVLCPHRASPQVWSKEACPDLLAGTFPPS